MIYLDHAQGTEAWLGERRGRFTASEFGKFVMQKDAAAKKAFLNNIESKIGEIYDGDDVPKSYEDFWMKRGKLLESSALAAYRSHMESIGESVELETIGLAVHETLPLGFSADSMVNARSYGLELKCPCAKIQLKRIEENKLPDDYVCQVHGSMFLSGAPHWDFFTWHPRLPAFYLRVYRDSFTEELGQGLIAFAQALEARKAQIAALLAA